MSHVYAKSWKSDAITYAKGNQAKDLESCTLLQSLCCFFIYFFILYMGCLQEYMCMYTTSLNRA